MIPAAAALLVSTVADCVEGEAKQTLNGAAVSLAEEERQLQQKKELTVELIYRTQELQSREVSCVQWAPEGEKFTYYQSDSETNRPCIWSYDLKTGKREIFIDSKKVKVLEEPKTEKRVTLSNYFWSPAGKDILLPSGNDLYLYNIASGTVKRLTNDEEIEKSPRFSPNGKKIAFIKHHKIQILSLQNDNVIVLQSENVTPS